MIFLNCACIVGIIWFIRNCQEIKDSRSPFPVILTALILIFSVITFLICNIVIPYKKVGQAIDKPEAEVIQIEHGGKKYEGVECLFLVKEFGPKTRPSTYKKKYKNFYGIDIN